MRGKSVVWSALMIILALLFAAPGRSQEPGEKYALLVGVRKYARTSELRDLQYPERDMEDLAAVLRDGGYRPENVVLMTQTAGAETTRFLPIAAKCSEPYCSRIVFRMGPGRAWHREGKR